MSSAQHAFSYVPIYVCNNSPMKFAFCVSKVIVHLLPHIHPSIHPLLAFLARSFVHAFYCSVTQCPRVSHTPPIESHSVETHSKLHMKHDLHRIRGCGSVESILKLTPLSPSLLDELFRRFSDNISSSVKVNVFVCPSKFSSQFSSAF